MQKPCTSLCLKTHTVTTPEPAPRNQNCQSIPTQPSSYTWKSNPQIASQPNDNQTAPKTILKMCQPQNSCTARMNRLTVGTDNDRTMHCNTESPSLQVSQYRTRHLSIHLLEKVDSQKAGAKQLCIACVLQSTAQKSPPPPNPQLI